MRGAHFNPPALLQTRKINTYTSIPLYPYTIFVLFLWSFTIDPNLTNLTSRFHPTYPGIVIRNELLSAPGSESGVIAFKDPWLIDFNDPPYGMRNQGVAAPLKIYPSLLNLTLGSDFKGVFLNQSGPPFWNPPYYSVRAEQQQTIPFHGEDITWYFQGWDGTDVQFEHPDQTETEVVFKQANAVARAQYKVHLVSNSQNAIVYNSGRHLVYTFLAYPHITVPFIVYSDRGNVL